MLNLYLSLIKFSHTVFALPFALIGFYLAYVKYQPTDFITKFILVILAMVFARNSAMAFNRYVDSEIDAKNPRTKEREIPSGKISKRAAIWFILLSMLAFIVTTFFINKLCFYLSPIALLVIMGYSFTKRFTWLCHYVLGLGLALAPIGAFLTISGKFDLITIILGICVFFWVGGFDIIYALQDASFDASLQLKSIPAHFGITRAIVVSRISHILSSIFLFIGVFLMKNQYPGIGWLSWVAFGMFSLLLLRQHLLVNDRNLSKINQAFFTTNGIASVILGSLIILDLLV
jgi:4-hydroxybenzoate polyprenyltransferase